MMHNMDDICIIKEIYKMLYHYEKEFLEKNKISINDALVLCCLKNGEEKSAGEVCEFIGLSNSRVSKVLCEVEDMGLIARKLGAEDRRQMFFSLTESGKNKVEEMKNTSLGIVSLLEKISKQCN